MAFPIAEFFGTVLGGLIAGLIGFGIARYNHNLALEDANRAAEKAKKDAVRVFFDRRAIYSEPGKNAS